MTTPDNGKRPLGFVNRRGHARSEVSVAELAGLSIDEQPVVSEDSTVLSPDPEATVTTKKPRPKKKPEKPSGDTPIRRKRSFAWSRQKTLIVIAVIILLVAIPVIVGEVLRGQYIASASSAKSTVQRLSTEALDLQKKDTYGSKDLRALTDKLEHARDEMCPGALLDNIALLYPRARDAHQACIAQRTKIATLATHQRDMVNMLSYIESVNALLERVGTPTGEAFAVVATEQSNWHSATDELKKLSPPTTLKTAHDQLLAATTSIADGWSKLNVASNDQNAADFQAAEEQLTKAYDAARASKAAYMDAVKNKQAAISTAARHL